MKQLLLVLFLTLTPAAYLTAATVKGWVKDAQTGEELIGAAVYVKENPAMGTTAGLDGTFVLKDVPEGKNITLVCSYISYETQEQNVNTLSGRDVLFNMKPSAMNLEGVTIIAANPGRTEAGARGIEKQAMNVVNVMSAKAIELSPDITVANVIQRMSGVTVERNSSGEGQYAILRGMDKRYNYTLVNGVKIPSPDKKNRFVPLDIFPSEMLDRLEVTKSLTANMEGDGIGGAVNLIMKDAPSERQFTANLSTGYNAMYFGRDFQSFNRGGIVKKSPYEALGKPEDYKVTMEDFTTSNLRMKWKKPLPDLTAGLSYGDRFFDDKLGVMLAGSFLSTSRGKESRLYYQPGTSHNGIEYRNYSSEQTRIGMHITNHSTGKMGYAIAKRAMLRGADVTLISGPVALNPVPFVKMVSVVTAQDMFEAVSNSFSEQDILIKSAAVADYRPAVVSDEKVKKKDGDMAIALERTTDILGHVGENKKPEQIICGFSMETQNMLENSRKKLKKKHLDMIVANNLKEQGAGFGTDTNRVTIISEKEEKNLELMSKEEVADEILNYILEFK